MTDPAIVWRLADCAIAVVAVLGAFALLAGADRRRARRLHRGYSEYERRRAEHSRIPPGWWYQEDGLGRIVPGSIRPDRPAT